jgi:hypothetical protein
MERRGWGGFPTPGALHVSTLGSVQEELEEGIGDVDLFTLQDDKLSLTVNAKWLQHLQVCTP